MDDLRKLGREIERLLGNRSQRWLEEQSGITQATISRLIHGKHKPSPETLAALAGPLGVQPVYLFRLAGLSIPEGDYDPKVAYIAQRLNNLPPAVREEAVDALGAQLDTIYNVAGIASSAPESSDEPEVQAMIEQLVQIARQLRGTQTEALVEVLERMKALQEAEESSEGGESSGRRRAS